MYEGLYEGLTQQMCVAYLKRIGIGTEDDGRVDCSHNADCGDASGGTSGSDELPAPTLRTLDALIYAHQCAVPFETLDSSDLGLDVSLATRDIFDKIVARRRGGYCFELNGLFDKLLQALGFKVRSCLARAVINRDYLPPQLHRMPVVELDGTLRIADVGFGGPIPASSLPLAQGVQTDSLGEGFRLSRDDKEGDGDWWLLERRAAGGWQRLLLFSTQPQHEVDFVAPHYYCATSPESHFVINRIVNLRTPAGMVQLFNKHFKRTEAGTVTERAVEDEADLVELLSSSFGIADVMF
jgi:N-hydroxyarylamine O-acetyltransferase